MSVFHVPNRLLLQALLPFQLREAFAFFMKVDPIQEVPPVTPECTLDETRDCPNRHSYADILSGIAVSGIAMRQMVCRRTGSRKFPHGRCPGTSLTSRPQASSCHRASQRIWPPQPARGWGGGLEKGKGSIGRWMPTLDASWMAWSCSHMSFLNFQLKTRPRVLPAMIFCMQRPSFRSAIRFTSHSHTHELGSGVRVQGA